jgi:hypothetical protein
MWSQHLLVVLLVAGCLLVVGWQAFNSLLGRKSRIGQCCARGCNPQPQPSKPPTQKIHFMPVEMLSKRR